MAILELWSAVCGLLPPPASLQRRDFVATAVSLPSIAPLIFPAAANGAEPPALSASWSATQGFSEKDFISFDEGAYKAMVDDQRRTPLFEKAIRQRLATLQDAVVVDLGTGPFAVLAIIAARAGAKKVYAIEANPAAAERARQAIAKASDVPAGVIEVRQGFSTAVQLPEKCDLCVAEIVGSIASEEGLHATIRDAQARLLKRPFDPASYIPARCQTIVAPATYALHYALGPPRFDWAKLKGEPIRLNCRDETLQLLADPVILEDCGFADRDLPPPGVWAPSPTLRFTVSAERVASNQKTYYDELRREGAAEAEAASVAAGASSALSGIACWPRLVLDPAGELIVESRGPKGEAQKSHWQTVLPLMAARPVPVTAGTALEIDATVTLGAAVDAPPRYELRGRVVAA